MSYFEKYFGENNHISDQNEMFVKCPFPHVDPDTNESYLEARPSAHVNLDKDVFHCKVCGQTHSEVSFYAAINNISYRQALELVDYANDQIDDWTDKEEFLERSKAPKELIRQFGWGNVYKDLRLGFEGSGISFPIFMNDVFMGSCRYRPNGDPKTILSKGAKNLVFPYDSWDREQPSLLVGGFKDCTTARSQGFNAITFTHGENSLPKLFKQSFKEQTVYICYDNDSAGKKGAIKAAVFIREAGGYPYIVDISQVCTEKGEDIHDFFHKYLRNASDLKNLLQESTPFDDETYEEERNKEYPLVKLEDATHGMYHNRLINSRVSVIAKFEDANQVPEYVEFEKFVEPGRNCVMEEGEKRVFALDESNIRDLLYLMENEDKLKTYLKRLVKIPTKEKGVAMRIKSFTNVFEAVVVDDISINDPEYKPFELNVYTIGHSLKSGDKARIFYKAVPHPLKNQKVVGLVTRIEESDVAVSQFKVTDDVKESLSCFQVQQDETVADKMKENAERLKAVAGVETLPQIAWSVDLFYHTPLQFAWNERIERAYLDAMLIGESRTGKSNTAKKLMDLYELGIFTSLKTTTEAGLIGGSDQTAGGYKTKLGVIPRNHRGAVIMEEFSGANYKIISSLTDIRSSNMVRIDRVNGTTHAPAMVRMLSISNQRKRANDDNIPIRQRSSGVEVVTDLIGAAEDIARYDFFLLIDKPDKFISPNEKPSLDSYPKQSYLNRVRWAWSRQPEQIIIEEQVKEFIVHMATKLNQRFDCHINFFGTEAWKKLTRLAIATACLTVSTDETYENVIVTEEHVEWAKNFLVACYDNELFNLKGYVDNERKYTECPDTSIHALQGLYRTNRNLILNLSRGTEFSQTQLRALSGLDNNDFNKVMNSLTEAYFIRYTRTGDRIVPTERFRKAFKSIKTNEYMTKLGAEY